MDDDFIPVEFLCFVYAQPDNRPCVLLRWSAADRILPVWLSAEQGHYFSRIIRGEEPRRNSAHAVIAEVMKRFGGPAPAIKVLSSWNGVYHAELDLGVPAAEGEDPIDIRLSDAILAVMGTGIPLLMHRSVLNAWSVSYHGESIEDVFAGNVPLHTLHSEDIAKSSDPATGGQSGVDEFEEWMNSLGVSEDDLRGDGANGSD